MSQSLRYQISAAVFGALAAAAASGKPLAGAVVLDNPRDPQAIRKGKRIVFFEDQRDGFIDQAAQQNRRSFRFAVGTISRDADDRAAADADHEAAVAAIRGAHTALISTLRCGPLRETETVFRAEGIDVGGALVMSTFEIEYVKPRPQ